jgi:hypothetical protein
VRVRIRVGDEGCASWGGVQVECASWGVLVKVFKFGVFKSGCAGGML